METIFLTGGAGMVGNNIQEAQWASRYRIVAPRVDELDLRDFSAVKKAIAKAAPSTIIHAAGRVGGIQANMSHPVEFLVENLDMGRNVVMAALELGVPKLLNLGSSCMYPRNVNGFLKEDMILSGALEPTNEGYAIAKIAVAKLCEFISRKNPELHYKTIIPCNLYGRWDKFDPERSHMIPAVIAKIVSAQKQAQANVEIWGDGLARREFMYAGDLANFIGFSLAKFSDLPTYLNVGLGFDHSVNEYYETAARVVGWQGSFVHDLSKPAGMARKLCDVSLLESFGWKASTSLQERLQKTLDFYLKEYSK
jgi:GDP-L-fucose synthase